MSRSANLLILYGGLATSVGALLLVYLISTFGFNLMGLYFWYFVPVGAFLVGLASGTGYAIASKWTNFRASASYLWFVVAVSLLTYGGSHYVTYLNYRADIAAMLEQIELVDPATNKPIPAEEIMGNITFLGYMQETIETTEMADVEDRDQDDAFELGKLGYLILLLEAIGFCGGAVIPLAVVSQGAYCEDCGRYMKKSWEGYHNSEATTADLKGKKDAKAAVIEAAMQDVMRRTFGGKSPEGTAEGLPDAEAQATTTDGEDDEAVSVTIDAAQLERWRADMSPKADAKALAKTHLLVKHCDLCGRQYADLKLEFLNIGKEPRSNDLAALYIDAEEVVAEDPT